MYVRLTQGPKLFRRRMCSRANPAVRSLGISDNSVFHKLPPSTKTELIALYKSNVVSTQEVDDRLLAQLAHFEEATATKIVSDFRNCKKVPNVENKVAYFVGFIRRQRVSAEGLLKPPSELNSAAFQFGVGQRQHEWLTQREFFVEQQLLLDESKKELAYLESPLTHSLKGESLQGRYSSLFDRVLGVARREFLPPHRLKPVEDVFKSFLRNSAPGKSDFESMVAVYARACQPALAFNTYRIMRTVGIEVDLALFNTLLRSCLFKRRSWGPILGEMDSLRISRDALSYELLITACSNTGEFAQAVKFLAEATAQKFELGALATSSLLHAFQALNMREAGEEQWRRLQGGSDSVALRDLANILLLRIRAQDFAACMELRDAVLVIHKCPDLCSLLIKAFVDTGRFKEAKDFFASLPKDMVSERTILAMFRVYRKERNSPQMKEMFDLNKLLPDRHCKAIYFAYIQNLCYNAQFSLVESVWEEFKARARTLQARKKTQTEENQADRSEWMEWHSTADPLQEEQTYESLIRILSDVQADVGSRWQTELLPLLLSVLTEASAVPSHSPEFPSRMTTYFRWILKFPGLTAENREAVQKHVDRLGVAV
jgi:hypothetical protein